MSILNGYPYRDMTPDDVRALIRRAHAERAAAMRQFFADLLGGDARPLSGTPRPSPP